MARIINFFTEYQREHSIIDTSEPCFSWEFSGDFKSKQKTYRIVVATTRKQAIELIGDVWDSGVVESSINVGIRLCGVKLLSHKMYYVNLLVNDIDNNEYSIQSTFETALLNKEDWKGAMFVGIPNNFNGGTLYFRNQYYIEDKKVSFARFYVCGLGYHEVYLNGKKVGDSVLNPGVTEYEKRALYCVYNLDNLVSGVNILGVEVGYGWFGSRKLKALIYIEYEDGSTLVDYSIAGNGWWASGTPIIDNGIYSGEVYDARLEDKCPGGWCSKEFTPTWENGWMYPIYASNPTQELELQKIEPIRVCKIFNEVSRVTMPNGNIVIDLGQNMAGWCRVKVSGTRGSSITMKYGEQLTNDGYVNQLNLRSARCSDTYILAGRDEEEYAPRFTFHGFRYVEIIISGDVRLLSCVGEHVHTDTRVIGSFKCSNDNLTKLHECALITEQNNEHSILEDCPQRDERFGWLNDLGSRIYQTVYNVDMSRFIPKFIRDITNTQNDDGSIKDTCPYNIGGWAADPVCVIYPLLAHYAYRYYGDKKTIEREYEGIKGWVNYLLSRSKDYIMEYSYYGDWVPPYPNIKADNIYVSSTYLYWHLKEMKILAEIIGKEEDVKLFEGHILKSAKAINDKYFNKQTCNYVSGLQAENAIAVSMGICPSEYIQKVVENIHNNVVEHNYHSTCGNIGYRHLFYVLADNGYIDDVIKILDNPEYPGWGYMIRNGATTVWERWEKEMQNLMHSFDHPMFGSFDAFLYNYLGGISVDGDAVASNKITIKPYIPSDINNVDCSMRTINGLIKSSWQKGKDGKVEYMITIPPMTTAKVIINNKEMVLGCGEYKF